MKTTTKYGVGILVFVAIACVVWLSIDPARAMAWAALTEVIKASAQLAAGG